jgi:hypothetical protein
MHKRHSRIWLEITGVRVERLHEITEADAEAEGIEWELWNNELKFYEDYAGTSRRGGFFEGSTYGFNNGKETQPAAVASFCTLWIDINGRESWISNPWVWVISFKVTSTTGKPELAGKEAAQS